MTTLIIGFAVGVLFTIGVRFLMLSSKDKRGRDHLKYNPVPLNSKMKIVIRKIIVDFSIRRFNRDFLLNVNLKGQTIMQLLHRAHFYEIITDLADVKFGVAIYVPLSPLTDVQRRCLFKILKEELKPFKDEEYDRDYFVIDAGTMVKYPGYLITKIITEVYNVDDVDLELHDEGFLPYHYKFDIPMKRNPN